MNQELEAQISARAYSLLANYLLQTFTPKAQSTLQGVFPTIIGFVNLGNLLFVGDHAKKRHRWPRVTKPIMFGKILCKLL